MSYPLELLLVVIAALLGASVVASKLSTQLRIPVLIFFIVLGILLGSEGIGGVYFDDASLARSIGTVALAFILFAGGLDSSWTSLRAVFWPAVSLATIGVLVTAGLVGAFAHLLLGLPWDAAFLLGAIVSSTDAAAVFGVLRGAGVRLKRRLAPLLEFESGSNDPTAVFLTISLAHLITDSDGSPWRFLMSFVLQMVVGGVYGAAIGEVGARLVNRVKLDYDGLYPAMTVAIACLAYGGAQLLGGSGFLAAYVAGLYLGRHNFLHRLALIQFHDGLAWLLQIAVFMTLGLLVFPSQLLPVTAAGLGLALFLGVAARPAAVFISLAFARHFSLREKVFVSWAGLRGAVPVILATIPLTEGVPHADYLFNLVFFVVLASVVLHGTTLSTLADRLGLSVKQQIGIAERRVASNLWELALPAGSPAAGRRVVELNMPSTALIVLLLRGKETFIPRGATILQPDDRILISTRKGDIDDLKIIFLGAEGGPAKEVALPSVEEGRG